MKARIALAVPLALSLIACDYSGSSSPIKSPVAPSPSTDGYSTLVAGSLRANNDVVVSMMDACDGDTFNDAGFGHICDRSGGIKFLDFIAALRQFGFITPWQFTPSNTQVEVGQTFAATNHGGETHTFTQVADFGGSIVPQLNDVLGNQAPAPECTTLEPDDFVVPGGTYRETVEHSGLVKFQCCIHPWMRLEAVSR